MSVTRKTQALVLLFLAAATPATAQEPPGRFPGLEAIDASYRKQLRDLHCRRIADLAALAEKADGPEADAAYRQLFGLAIAEGLCRDAQDAARRCLAAAAGRDVRAMAALVKAQASADRGEHDRALDDWKDLLRQAARGPEADADTEVALAVGEAMLQRFIGEGRYDVARRLCGLACDDSAPDAIQDHFKGRMARLDRVGKPAPQVATKDVDGHPVSLAELKGKVVLVEFWATWCPPCVEAIPALQELERKYQDRGLVILGVNVDAMHEDADDQKRALATVRRFLLRHRVAWTNVMSGRGSGDIASAFGVEEIPANFLIGRDGTVVAVEQAGEALERVISGALGHGGNEHGR